MRALFRFDGEMSMMPERVRFASHRFPFFVEASQCSQADCECAEVTFYLDEGADGEQLPSSPMNIRICVDPETWREVDAPQRPPAAAAIVEEFLREFPAQQRAEYQSAGRRKKEIGRRLREHLIAPKDIQAGMLVPWGEITFDRTSGHADVASFLDAFKHESAEYLVDDLYCANPGCKCREVHLLFLEYQPADQHGNPARTDPRFMAIISLDGQLKIERCIRVTAKEASAIAAAWRSGFGDNLRELKWRYAKVKEIGGRTHISPTTVVGPAKFPYSTPKPARPGRNDPCPCGSGMKYKRCCGRSE